MKRGVCFLLVLLTIAMLTLSGVVSAQEDGGQDVESTEDQTPTTSEEVHDEEIAELDTPEEPVETIDQTATIPEEVSHKEDTETNEDNFDDIYEDLDDEEFSANPGLTPGHPLYAIDTFFEEQLVGDNPERALKYKEEKIAEAKVMIDQGNPEKAKEVLDKVENYGDILEREVSPEMERRTRQSSKSVKELLREIESELEGEEWDEVKDKIKEHEEREDNIAVAAKISGQIEELCNTLSKIDPLEYSRVCKVDDDSPVWQKNLNKDLTKEQQKEAEEFFKTMSSCFENPRECECDNIKIESFSNQCSIIAPLAADCEEGDESACSAMEEMEDPIELLPDYLQDVMEQVERRYNNDRFDLHMPKECQEEGAKTPEQCMKVMFKVHAPQECIEALDSGKIKFSNEREARTQCEKIMFEANAPSECVEAGLTDHKECEKVMFEQNAPPECVEAGLTGENRLDHRKCEELMRRVHENEGQMDRGFGGGNCKNIQDSKERLACYDGATQGVQDFKERGGPQGGWPEPCERAGAKDRQSCEQIMRKFGEDRNNMEQEYRKDYNKYYDNRYDEKFKETMDRERQCVQRCSSEGKAWDFSDGECRCSGGDDRRYEEGEYPQPDDYPRDSPPEFEDGRYEEGEYPPPEFEDGRYEEGKYPQPEFEDRRYEEGKYPPPEFEDGRYEEGKYPPPEFEDGRYEEGKYPQPEDDQRDYQQPPQEYEEPKESSNEPSEPSNGGESYGGDSNSESDSGGGEEPSQ